MMEKIEVILTEGNLKGVKNIQIKDTIIKGEDEKIKSGVYDEKLQVINNRIRSYRPITILDYKPEDVEGRAKQNQELLLWDNKTWDFGEYPDYLKNKEGFWPEGITSGTQEQYPELFKRINNQLFLDFKTLVKSSAVLKGYNRPGRVRGGTYQDVDDFFNFSTIKLCERRLKQYDLNSSCRIWQNWPSYLVRTLPQYLIEYNKSKIDYDVEDRWPLIRDEETGKYKKRDFEIEMKLPHYLVSEKEFLGLLNKVISGIPEAESFEFDILMDLLYGITITNKRFIKELSKIVKIQMYESEEGLL